MKTSPKIKLARKLMTKDEVRKNVPVYFSRAWTQRRVVRLNKELAKMKK